MRKFLTLAAFIALSLIANAQTLQDTLAQVDKLFSMFKPRNPGCQLSISRNGVVIYSKAWGMADLEHGVPLTTSSVIEAGSVSKQFTAAAILLLAQQGKLSLDDDIRKYLPEVPDYGYVIRIRHLLHHSSGLRDWGSVMAIANWPRTTKTYSNDDALYIVSHQKALNNIPGSEFIYSNSNFNLLALIVKRVTGMELAEFTHTYIFVPAGMTHTQWRDNYKRIVLNRAIAYDKIVTGYQTDMPNEYAYGNGGLLTTTEDLLKWNDYYWSGKLGNPSLLAQQIAVDHLNNAEVNPYGMGLFIAHRKGWDYINHSGATAGYRAYLLRYPQLNLSIAYLSNFSGAGIGPVSQIEDLLVTTEGPYIQPAVTAPPAYSMPAARLKAFAGWYRNEKTGGGDELTIKDDTLHTRHLTLRPTGPGTFSVGDLQLVFTDKGFMMITPAFTTDTTLYTAVSAAGTGTDYLKAYAGKYYSAETESRCTVAVKDGKLILHIDPVTDLELKPTYYDGFDYADNSGDIYFQRDAGGKISGFKVSIDRARNVAFSKN
jgi:CubicO group peptidase (beta-lactamase class C family)